MTGLLDGYPVGHYDVLIELYLVGVGAPVAVYGPFDDPSLRALPLESERDDRFFFDDDRHFDDDYHYGAAGLGWALPGLALLGVVLRRRAR